MNSTLLMLGIAGPELSPEEDALFRELRPAGFVLHARNLVTAAQTRALTDSLRAPGGRAPLIALRLEEALAASGPLLPTMPAPGELAALNHAKTTGMAGRITGELLRMLGVNLHLGPDLNVTRHPPDGASRWGGDCQRVIDHAGLWNRWLVHRGPLACVRTFPGCGGAVPESEEDLPVSSSTVDDLLRSDLLPFTALMPEFHAVLTGHARFPRIDAELPASLSPRIMRLLFRDQLGFDHHLAITEDLDAQGIASRWGQADAARLAIEAGNDLALIGRPTPALIRETVAEMAAVSASQRHDATVRLDRASWNAPASFPWSEKKWDELCAKMDGLRTRIPSIRPMPPGG